MPVRVIVRGVAGARRGAGVGRQRAAQAGAGARPAGRWPSPRFRPSPELFAMLDVLVPGDAPVAERVARARALHPVLDAYVPPMQGSTLTPTMTSASRKRNVVPARAELILDCRTLPGHDRGGAARRDPRDPGRPRGRARAGRAARRRDPLAARARCSRTPAARTSSGSSPARCCVPCITTGFTNSHWVREAFGTIAYGFLPLRHTDPVLAASVIHSADERVHQDDVAVAVEYLEHVVRQVTGGSQMSEEPLRLGGMALQNGLFLHGPTSWSAAVRDDDGRVHVASGAQDAATRVRAAGAAGPRRGAAGRDGDCCCRRCARRCPRRASRSRRPGSAWRWRCSADGRRGAAGEQALAGPGRAARRASPAWCRRRWPCARATWPSYHGAEHKTIGAYETGGEAVDATKEHERCGSHLIGPLLLGTVAANALAARVPARHRNAARAGGSLAALGVAVELFGWMDRHRDSPLSRGARAARARAAGGGLDRGARRAPSSRWPDGRSTSCSGSSATPPSG